MYVRALLHSLHGGSIDIHLARHKDGCYCCSCCCLVSGTTAVCFFLFSGLRTSSLPEPAYFLPLLQQYTRSVTHGLHPKRRNKLSRKSTFPFLLELVGNFQWGLLARSLRGWVLLAGCWTAPTSSWPPHTFSFFRTVSSTRRQAPTCLPPVDTTHQSSSPSAIQRHRTIAPSYTTTRERTDSARRHHQIDGRLICGTFGHTLLCLYNTWIRGSSVLYYCL